MVWGSACTERASWEEFQKINNELSCELTVELHRLEGLNIPDHVQGETRALINEADDGKMYSKR